MADGFTFAAPEWRAEDMEGGRMVDLSRGATWTRVTAPSTAHGAGAGAVYLLFHGVSWFSWTFDSVVPMLAARAPAATIVVFDAYGRGRSDCARPAPPHTPDHHHPVNTPPMFSRQAHDLLDALGLLRDGPAEPQEPQEPHEPHEPQEPYVHVIGHSMGGGNAAQFAVDYPEIVASVLLLTPAGLAVDIPFMGKLLTVPLLGSMLMATVGRVALRHTLHSARCANDFIDPDAIPDVVDGIIERLDWCISHKPGWISSFHSTLCAYPFSGMRSVFEDLVRTCHESATRLTVVFAERDQAINSDGSARILAELGGTPMSIPDAGHSFFIENPGLIAPILDSHMEL